MMYEQLTLCELTALQSMLYEGTGDAYRLARFEGVAKEWTDRYRSLHQDLGLLFIEAATQLISRIHAGRQPQAA
jgi:hypothetical protein